jgi:hypothetical protein
MDKRMLHELCRIYFVMLQGQHEQFRSEEEMRKEKREEAIRRQVRFHNTSSTLGMNFGHRG